MVAPKLFTVDMPSKPSKKYPKWMPRMQSSSTQCCLCVVGVFMFLVGIIMLSTGVCLILNYGYFDESLLPPELRSDDGKRTVGIILTVSGLLCVFISVLVSSIYLCSRKPTRRFPSENLDKLPGSSARQDSAGSRNTATRGKIGPVNGKAAPGVITGKVSQSHKMGAVSKDMHSSSVPPNRHLVSKQRKRKKHKLLHSKSKLEGIQEKDPDAISRKFSEKDISVQGEDNVAFRAESPDDSVNMVSEVRPKEGNGAYDQEDSSPLDTISNEKQSLTSVSIGETQQGIELPPISHKPSIVVSEHSDDAKPDFDRSSTSSGFTGSEKSDLTMERQLSDLLK